MKLLPTLLLALYGATAFAQSNGSSDGWKIGLNFSPDQYLNSTELQTSEYTGYELQPAGFSYTTGATLQREIAPSIDVGAGIGVSRKGYAGTFYCHTCDFGFAPQPEPIIQWYKEAEVNARYRFIDKKYGMHVEGALIGGHHRAPITTLELGAIMGNNYLLSGQMGLGANVDIGSHFNLSWTATYRQSFTNFMVDNDLRLESIGLRTALMYRFAKKGA